MLTKAEMDLYQAIDDFQKANGYTPPQIVLMETLGKSQPTISIQLARLIEKNKARRKAKFHIQLLPLGE